MTRDRVRAGLPAGWLAAAIVATLAMLGWLAWHAGTALATLHDMQTSHAAAATRHDTLVSLRADLQRTAQLGIATGDVHWLEQHARTEAALRGAIEEILGNELRDSERVPLQEAVKAIDRLSVLEARALKLAEAGGTEEALDVVTGPEYLADGRGLTAALERFDKSYHRWGLERSVGLTQQETLSLTGAFVLFAAVIGAWVLLILRLQRERNALVVEMDRRADAEAHLLQAQKNEVLGQLSGSVAHDVDNVLSAAAGYAGLARRSAEPGARTLALDGLDKAVAQGRGLTRNLLSFTRQETSVRRPVELGQLVRETHSWLGPLLPANIDLQILRRHAGELWVDGDPVQIQQAFANLALNARDAMPDGGSLTVSICRRPPEALGDPPSNAEWTACLSVRDTGPGMDAATLAHACDPLFTTKPAGQGTGLGLTAVVRIIEGHGGRVVIESEPGKGTVVRMLLPASERGPGRATRNETAGQPARKAAVYSNDPYALELLAATLEDAGLDVPATGDLAEMDRRQPDTDIVLIDWQGDDDTVPGALARIRDQHEHARIILLTNPLEPALETELAALAMIVARPVPLGELGELALRMASAREREVTV